MFDRKAEQVTRGRRKWTGAEFGNFCFSPNIIRIRKSKQ